MFFKINVLFIFLLFFHSIAQANTYTTDFKNCTITKIGDNLWRAKFTLTVDIDYTSDATNNNTFYAWVPKVDNETGKPFREYRDRTVNPGLRNIVTPSSIVARSLLNDINFYSSNSNDEKVIKSGGDISVDFSTKNNGAYPGLFITYRNLSTPGGGLLSGPVYIIAGSGCRYSFSQTFPPIDEIIPPEPNFTMKSVVWNLKTADLSELPDLSQKTGYSTTVTDPNLNKLCLSYVTNAVKKNTYSVNVTNSFVTKEGKQLFYINNSSGSLYYRFDLISDSGSSANNFSYPSSSSKYITLNTTSSSLSGLSNMCWSPKIFLFKDSSTSQGSYSSVINLTISPKS